MHTSKAIKKLHLNVNYNPINSPNDEHSTRNHTRIIAKQKASNCAQKCQHVYKSGRSKFGFLSYKIFTACNVIGWLILSWHNYAKTNDTESWSSQKSLPYSSMSYTTLANAHTTNHNWLHPTMLLSLLALESITEIVYSINIAHSLRPQEPREIVRVRRMTERLHYWSSTWTWQFDSPFNRLVWLVREVSGASFQHICCAFCHGQYYYLIMLLQMQTLPNAELKWEDDDE